MTNVDNDNDNPATITVSERRRIMKMVEAHERAQWAWASLAVWAKYITAIGAGFVTLKIGASSLLGALKDYLGAK